MSVVQIVPKVFRRGIVVLSDYHMTLPVQIFLGALPYLIRLFRRLLIVHSMGEGAQVEPATLQTGD